MGNETAGGVCVHFSQPIQVTLVPTGNVVNDSLADHH